MPTHKCPTCEADNDKALAILIRLETKMDLVVGPDGTGGRLKQLEDDVLVLKLEQGTAKGIVSGVSKATLVIWSIAIVAFEYVIHKL